MQEIKLKLTVEEINLIMEGLGNLPFNKVFNLVGKVQEQAAAQIKKAEVSPVEAVPVAERTAT